MPGKYRPVSTAEKRAEYAAKGLEWPKYPDGTDQQWNREARGFVDGGRFLCWEAVQKQRKRDRERHAIGRTKPGICATKGCKNPKFMLSTGNYHIQCGDHIREGNATRVWLPSGRQAYFGGFVEIARQARDDYYKRSKNVA